MTGSRTAFLTVSLIGLCAVFHCALPARAAFGDRITVSGTEFRAGADRIWINGANTPWHTWNEFGGQYDAGWWDRHFAELHENGINAARVWISCSGETGIRIDPSGYVSGCTPAFWKDVDSLLQIARRRQVYIMATLLSFDHFQDNHPAFASWRCMLTNSANIDSLVTNYVVPFVDRYKDNPWLWSIDLCNEPDWVHENPHRGGISWDWIQTYFAKAAVAIHARSQVLVTVGFSMGPKYNGVPPRTNVLSDAALQVRVGGDPRARVDFYASHHYSWMDRAWGNAFYQSPAAYGMDVSRPVVIGECPARGTRGHTVVEDYENGYRNGLQGAMGWTSNGVDANGSLKELGPATRAFRDNHYSLVFPGMPVPARNPKPSTNAPGADPANR